MKTFAFAFLFAGIAFSLYSQSPAPVKLNKFQDGIHHWYLEHPVRTYPRLDSSQVLRIADNFLAWQNADGGWPKNIDWLGVMNVDSAREALSEHYRQSTLDNTNIYPQIAYLSEVYTKTAIENIITFSETSNTHKLAICFVTT